MSAAPLSERQIQRYSRQLLLDPIGGAGQARLAKARALVIGVGGLGSPAALYLAAAGVGHLTLVDPDRVELHNLHRQILHREADLGRPKVQSGREALLALDSALSVEIIEGRVDAATAPALFAAHDLVLDGSDGFPTRFLANDQAMATGTPLVHGAVLGFSGQLMCVDPEGPGGCYRCLFEAPPPAGEVPPCSEAGVLGAAAGVIGAAMAAEAVKILTGAGEPLYGRLFIYDGLLGRSRTVEVPRRPGCEACAGAPARAEVRA